MLLVYPNNLSCDLLFILQDWLRESPDAFSPVAGVFLTAQGCRQGGGVKPPSPDFKLVLCVQAVTTKRTSKIQKNKTGKTAFRL